MNINFGLFPPLAEVPSVDRKSPLGRSTAKALAKKSAITRRALSDLQGWIDGLPPCASEAAE
jgi:methylenetetrahydrofolate--tRNA-(uracil-5-)-methyltransferase